VTGFVYQRGKARTCRFLNSERDPVTGTYPTISSCGCSTEEAYEAAREADQGGAVRISARTVAQFFTEWFAVEPSPAATAWRSCRDYAHARTQRERHR